MSKQITYAKIENYKGIKSLEVDNLSRFVGVFGLNGAGKTSFLEAIKNAIKLEYNGNSKVRFGEENGTIEIHFGDEFKIKRVIGSKSKLDVEIDGASIKRPQEWLDNIFLGSIGDPQKFISLPRNEKTRYILSTYGKEEEYNQLENERQKFFEKRTEIGRKKRSKEEENKAVDTTLFHKLEEAKSTSELEAKLEEANEKNKDYYELQNRKDKGEFVLKEKQNLQEQYQQKISYSEERIKQLEEEIKAEKEKLVENQEIYKNCKSETNQAEDLLADINKRIKEFSYIDTKEIKEKIEAIRKENEELIEIKTKKTMYEEDLKKEEELIAQRKELDETVKSYEDKQNDLLRTIKTAYELKVEDGIMKVNIDNQRIPIDELNTATQIDLAIDIILAGPNKIKILTIENANALDPKTMEKVKTKIEAAEGQCFLETVYKTGYESITIKDGEII